MTFSQLRTFVAVARTGSVKAAAEALAVTQPSVSAAVGALSRELGVELTEKSGRTIRLTPAGHAFLLFVADGLGLIEEGTRAAQEAARTTEALVRIAAVTTAGEYLLPELLQRFSACNPEIALSLEVANRRRVFQQILDRDSDIAIAGRLPSDERRLRATPFLPNESVLITAADDPLVRRGSVAVEELAGRTWLLREEGSGTRRMLEEFLEQHALQPRTLTLGSNGAIKQAVRVGLGISLQSRITVEVELESGILATIAVEDIPLRQWYVIRSSSGPVRPPVQAFFDFVAASASLEPAGGS
ncbi:MAG: LysR family transcriptional regulator [Gaiellaceae bacterium]